MEISPVLPVRRVVPLFTLPDKHGTEYNLAKQRGRDHLLLVLFRAGSESQTYLQSLAQQQAEWRQLPARSIVVVANEDAAGALGSTPSTVLIDRDNKAFDRFLPPEAQAGVFALDRYGDLYQQWLVTRPSDLPTPDDITGWLQAIAMQCTI